MEKKFIIGIIMVITIFSSIQSMAETDLKEYYKSLGATVHERRGELMIDLSESTKLRDNDLINIYQLKNLRVLSVSANISDAGINYILKNENIQSLGASSLKINGEGFKSFNKSIKLRILNLDNTMLNDEGLKNICDLQNLEELQIGGTKITDNGLKQLTKMPKLKALCINNNNITDIGLQYLAGIKNLQYVLVFGTKVTAKGIADLKRKIPHHCEIENTVPSDAGLR